MRCWKWLKKNIYGNIRICGQYFDVCHSITLSICKHIRFDALLVVDAHFFSHFFFTLFHIVWNIYCSFVIVVGTRNIYICFTTNYTYCTFRPNNSGLGVRYTVGSIFPYSDSGMTVNSNSTKRTLGSIDIFLVFFLSKGNFIYWNVFENA